MLISRFELRNVERICERLELRLRNDLIASNLYSPDKMRVNAFVSFEDEKAVFTRWVERLSTGNHGLVKKWRLELEYLSTPFEYGFDQLQFLIDKLEEIE